MYNKGFTINHTQIFEGVSLTQIVSIPQILLTTIAMLIDKIVIQ